MGEHAGSRYTAQRMGSWGARQVLSRPSPGDWRRHTAVRQRLLEFVRLELFRPFLRQTIRATAKLVATCPARPIRRRRVGRGRVGRLFFACGRRRRWSRGHAFRPKQFGLERGTRRTTASSSAAIASTPRFGAVRGAGADTATALSRRSHRVVA